MKLIIVSSFIIAVSFIYTSWIFLSITKDLSANDGKYIQRLEHKIDVLERIIKDQNDIIKGKKSYERVIK